MGLPVVILFDIDGTLLITGGASSRCIERAARKVLGEQLRWSPVTEGTTDPQIMLELASHNDIAGAEAHLDRYRQVYLQELEQELQNVRDQVVVLPGVRALLTKLAHRQDVIVGLLTGNYQQAAQMKLAVAGLDQAMFKVAAYAEDGAQRSALVATALAQAQQLTGQTIEAAQTILIGDTPRDIACARANGCLVLSVATGRYSLTQLQELKPDVAVVNLDDQQPLEQLIAVAAALP
ncbi:MAG: HAD hydrolase-like protein [Phycisphaerales bacterium]|nr:HAD hydrolase-like protein [Phycisphaerales bacterium]